MSDEPGNLPAVVDAAPPVTTPKLQSSVVAVPMMIASAGDHAARRFLEFFAAQIRNKNTRMAYHRAACHFFAWVEQHQIGELADIEPIHVAAYIEVLQTTAAKPTVKLHLAAIRMLFDWLIIGQVLAVNPAHAVRGPKHVVKRGKTPVRPPISAYSPARIRRPKTTRTPTATDARSGVHESPSDKRTMDPARPSAPLESPVTSGATSTRAATTMPARTSTLVDAARSGGSHGMTVWRRAMPSKNSWTNRSRT